MDSLRFGDYYKHFKGGEYLFQYITYPIDMSHTIGELNYVLTAKHADNPEEEVKIFEKDGVFFSDRYHYMVLYKRISDNSLWVRRVDDFFGYKKHEDGSLEKRFVLMDNKPRLRHYSELLQEEKEQDKKFIEDARRRSEVIMKRVTTKDKEH
jgi:hypothetical protein